MYSKKTKEIIYLIGNKDYCYKRKFTFIEIIIVLLTISIIVGISSNKFVNVEKSAKAFVMNRDLEMIELAVREYASITHNKEYPFLDISGDNKIDDNDIYLTSESIPLSLKRELLSIGDNGNNIYKLDMEKLCPYLNRLKNDKVEYLYSLESNIAIDPIGTENEDSINHHILEKSIKKNNKLNI